MGRRYGDAVAQIDLRTIEPGQYTLRTQGRRVVAAVFSVRGLNRRISAHVISHNSFSDFDSLAPRLARSPRRRPPRNYSTHCDWRPLQLGRCRPRLCRGGKAVPCGRRPANALYARLGVIRADSEQHPLPETSAQLAKDLESNPILQTDKALRMFCSL